MKKLISYLCMVLLLFTLAACNNTEAPPPENTDPEPETEDVTDPVDTPADPVGNYTIEIDVQDYGVITAELDGSAAPITVSNFVNLVEDGFYDGLLFHRVMSGFMIQGGDPKGDGSGGSDENIKGEFASNGVDNPLSHTRGALSMARRNSPMDSASSQFFIVHEDSTFLDGDYAAFGYVTDGMDVVDAICNSIVNIGSNGEVADEDKPVITSIRIVESE